MEQAELRIDRIVDVHCHVLPALDDGSRSMEESIEMLRIAAEEGITDIIATPHYKAGRHNARAATIEKRLTELQEAAERQGIPITLYPGNEIEYYSDVEEGLRTGQILPIGHSDYVLVEFSPRDSFMRIRNGLDHIMSLEYTPILAHVERYICMLSDYRNVEELHAMGVKIQVNADSVAGRLGLRVKKFVHRLLAEQLVHYIGTDAHRSKGRAPMMQKCRKVLRRKLDPEYVEDLLYRNALELLTGNESTQTSN